MVILLLAVAGHGVEAKKPAREDSKVKNIIYMIGDGMGLCHVSMLQIEAGYAPTAFDRAKNTALIKTYSANNRVTDSAAAGTALATGYKTNNGTIGQLPDGTRVESIMAKAEKQNYATGLVVTCYLQHATPAAFYAHVKGRGDSDRISYDFMESGVDVAFGGGSKIFKKAFEKNGEDYVSRLKDEGYSVIYDQSEMDGIHSGRVVGLFAEENLPELKDGRGDYLSDLELFLFLGLFFEGLSVNAGFRSIKLLRRLSYSLLSCRLFLPALIKGRAEYAVLHIQILKDPAFSA